jgi:hypothetical protein
MGILSGSSWHRALSTRDERHNRLANSTSFPTISSQVGPSSPLAGWHLAGIRRQNKKIRQGQFASSGLLRYTLSHRGAVLILATASPVDVTGQSFIYQGG